MTQDENEDKIIPSPRKDLAICGGSLARRGLQLAGDLTSRRFEPTLNIDLGNNVTMELVLIPAGKFMMGSPEDEKDREDDEGPQHEVTISKPFYIGIHHVTRRQFAAFVDDKGYKTDAEKDGWSYAWDGSELREVNGASWKEPHFAQTDEHPVVCVSHNDAVAFCEWLSKKSGKRIKLPTEAQWEYSYRAGTTTAYQWGDDPDGGKAWCNAAWDDGDGFTSPVGKFKNSFGLNDMPGNAGEWCLDWYDEDYYSTTYNVDPQRFGSGTLRVLRGGSWDSISQFGRSACRNYSSPDLRYSDVGFRVSVDITVPAKQSAIVPADNAEKQITLDLGNNVTMKLVLIPAGTFMMGIPKDEKYFDRRESPQHEVTISKPFYMGVYVVTKEQWKAVMGTTPWTRPPEHDGHGYVDVDDDPAELVQEQSTDTTPSDAMNEEIDANWISWDNATAFCKKLSTKTGKTVSLPTEAQWEYACRAGNTRIRFSSGRNENLAVGQIPNDWGLYYQRYSGNLQLEWCSDRYDKDYYYADANDRDPRGPDFGNERVMRKGEDPANRGANPPRTRRWRIVFRVSVELPTAHQQQGQEAQPK